MMIGRLTLVLWLAVCVSAVAVTYSNHQARGLFSHWQGQIKAQRQYEVQWGQLLIEKSSQASYARLEYLAKTKLNMAVPKLEQMLRVEEKKP